MKPLISSDCYDLVVMAGVLASLLLGALGALCVHIRRAVLGKRLLDACAGDYETAVLAIENVRRENSLMDEAFRRGGRR